jgi:hypothetical protein
VRETIDADADDDDDGGGRASIAAEDGGIAGTVALPRARKVGAVRASDAAEDAAGVVFAFSALSQDSASSRVPNPRAIVRGKYWRRSHGP